MATLSRRNKIILVAGGLIVTLAAAVAIFSQRVEPASSDRACAPSLPPIHPCT